MKLYEQYLLESIDIKDTIKYLNNKISIDKKAISFLKDRIKNLKYFIKKTNKYKGTDFPNVHLPYKTRIQQMQDSIEYHEKILRNHNNNLKRSKRLLAKLPNE